MPGLRHSITSPEGGLAPGAKDLLDHGFKLVFNNDYHC